MVAQKYKSIKSDANSHQHLQLFWYFLKYGQALSEWMAKQPTFSLQNLTPLQYSTPMTPLQDSTAQNAQCILWRRGTTLSTLRADRFHSFMAVNMLSRAWIFYFHFDQ